MTMASKEYNNHIFFENLLHLCKEKKWSPNRLAKETKVSASFISKIKNLGAHPSNTLLLNLYNIFSDETKILNPFWLFYNEGPQYLYLKKENILKSDPLQNEPDQIVQTVKKIRTLPKVKQDSLLQIINGFITFNK